MIYMLQTEKKNSDSMAKSGKKSCSSEKKKKKKKSSKRTLFNDKIIMLWFTTVVLNPRRTNDTSRCMICREIFPSTDGLLGHISNCDTEKEAKEYDSDVEVLMDTSESVDAAMEEVPVSVCRKKTSSSLRFKLKFSPNDMHWKAVDTQQQQQVSSINLLDFLPKLSCTGKRCRRGIASVSSSKDVLVHTTNTKTLKEKTGKRPMMKTENIKKNRCSASNKETETGVVDYRTPWMTLRMVETIRRIGCFTKPVWLIEKELQESDIKRNQGRLFIPNCKKFEDLMSDDEKEMVVVCKEKKLRGGIKVGVVWPMGEVVGFDFKKWESLEQYVLAKPWSEMVRDYRMKKGDSVLLWSFRDRDRRLWFAINIRRLGNNDAGSSATEPAAPNRPGR